MVRGQGYRSPAADSECDERTCHWGERKYSGGHCVRADLYKGAPRALLLVYPARQTGAATGLPRGCCGQVPRPLPESK